MIQMIATRDDIPSDLYKNMGQHLLPINEKKVGAVPI
jgi:hypothetical protein